ncbi:protein lethal(2)essential for life-like [Lycorma delicatula]|uniref:protein lethal(2)essential for life-like n=1 Tax=Lycorma delicatula TaxID=130591 RepID=UPI003F51596F
MSLLPYFVNELFDEVNNPLNDQYFGLGLRPSTDFPRLLQAPMYSGYLRPWRHLARSDSGISSLQNTKDNFKVNLDVQQFKPEEVTVKLQGDYLVVEGKHEERQDKHGFVSRQFQRRYKLPENIDHDKIKSQLSSDGVLTLTAPKKPEESIGGRAIPVEQTNQPAVKQTKESEKQEEMES